MWFIRRVWWLKCFVILFAALWGLISSMDVSYLATLGKERLIALLLADRLTAPALVAPKLEAAEVGAVKRETADDAALPITPLHTHHPPPVDTPTPVHHPPPVDTHHPPPLDLEDSFKDAQSWPHDSLDISSTQPRNDAFYDDTMVPVTPKAAACDSYVDTLVMSPGESTKLSPEPEMSEISTFFDDEPGLFSDVFQGVSPAPPSPSCSEEFGSQEVGQFFQARLPEILDTP